MSTVVMDKVVEELAGLPSEMQWRVLEFARALARSRPRGVPGKDLVGLAGTIPPEDLAEISQAIEQTCEQVDLDAW